MVKYAWQAVGQTNVVQARIWQNMRGRLWARLAWCRPGYGKICVAGCGPD